MEDKYTYVLAELKRRSGERQLMAVALATKISRRTIGNILEGKDTLISNVDSLYKYLKKKEGKDTL